MWCGFYQPKILKLWWFNALEMWRVVLSVNRVCFRLVSSLSVCPKKCCKVHMFLIIAGFICCTSCILYAHSLRHLCRTFCTMLHGIRSCQLSHHTFFRVSHTASCIQCCLLWFWVFWVIYLSEHSLFPRTAASNAELFYQLETASGFWRQNFHCTLTTDFISLYQNTVHFSHGDAMTHSLSYPYHVTSYTDSKHRNCRQCHRAALCMCTVSHCLAQQTLTRFGIQCCCLWCSVFSGQ